MKKIKTTIFKAINHILDNMTVYLMCFAVVMIAAVAFYNHHELISLEVKTAAIRSDLTELHESHASLLEFYERDMNRIAGDFEKYDVLYRAIEVLNEENHILAERIRELKAPTQINDTESILTMIRIICQYRGFDYELALGVALIESGVNPQAVNVNADGTVDRGLYQFNDLFRYVYSLSEDDAHCVITSTEYFIIHFERLTNDYDLHTAFRAYNTGEFGAVTLGRGHAYADRMFKALGLERTT